MFNLKTPFKFIMDIVSTKYYEVKINELESSAHEVIRNVSHRMKEPIVREQVIQFNKNYGKDLYRAAQYFESGQDIVENLIKGPTFKRELFELYKTISSVNPDENDLHLQVMNLMAQQYFNQSLDPDTNSAKSA